MFNWIKSDEAGSMRKLINDFLFTKWRRLRTWHLYVRICQVWQLLGNDWGGRSLLPCCWLIRGSSIWSILCLLQELNGLHCFSENWEETCSRLAGCRLQCQKAQVMQRSMHAQIHFFKMFTAASTIFKAQNLVCIRSTQVCNESTEKDPRFWSKLVQKCSKISSSPFCLLSLALLSSRNSALTAELHTFSDATRWLFF